jgi:16S rRNA (guanine527-N7)-methyltransferase
MSALQDQLYELLCGPDFARFGMSDGTLKALARYGALMADWNEKINLTAIVDAPGMADKHFYDSLLVLYHLGEDAASLIDVGTGAGFPGLVVAIARPDLAVTLADSLNKRILFLQTVVQTLGLTNVTCLHGRAEELAAQPGLRQGFDLACARAVARMDVLSEYCLPFVKVGGRFLACKGPTGDQETEEAAAAIAALGGTKPVLHAHSLPSGDKRLIIEVAKTRPTPKKYPRRPGEAKRRPIR